jgi:uncharacterized OB-fold protein
MMAVGAALGLPAEDGWPDASVLGSTGAPRAEKRGAATVVAARDRTATALAQLTDRDADRVAIDMPLELTVRRLDDDGGFHNHFCKARPA